MLLRTLIRTAGASLLLAGCSVGPSTTPLPANHPANPAATETAIPIPSETLVIAGENGSPAADSDASDADPGEMNMAGADHDMKGMHHGHDMAAMKHAPPTTQKDASAAESAPRWTPSTVPATEPRSDKPVYTCKMHHEIRSNQPGQCPKCGMKLVPAAQASSRPDHSEHGEHR